MLSHPHLRYKAFHAHPRGVNTLFTRRGVWRPHLTCFEAVRKLRHQIYDPERIQCWCFPGPFRITDPRSGFWTRDIVLWSMIQTRPLGGKISRDCHNCSSAYRAAMSWHWYVHQESGSHPHVFLSTLWTHTSWLMAPGVNFDGRL